MYSLKDIDAIMTWKKNKAERNVDKMIKNRRLIDYLEKTKPMKSKFGDLNILNDYDYKYMVEMMFICSKLVSSVNIDEHKKFVDFIQKLIDAYLTYDNAKLEETKALINMSV